MKTGNRFLFYHKSQSPLVHIDTYSTTYKSAQVRLSVHIRRTMMSSTLISRIFTGYPSLQSCLEWLPSFYILVPGASRAPTLGEKPVGVATSPCLDRERESDEVCLVWQTKYSTQR